MLLLGLNLHSSELKYYVFSTSSTASAAASSNSQQRQAEIHVRPEIEVTMEPIVVGIEMGGPEITINASGGGTITRGGNLPENYLQVRN